MCGCDETFHRRHHKVAFLRVTPRQSLHGAVACMAVCGCICEVTMKRVDHRKTKSTARDRECPLAEIKTLQYNWTLRIYLLNNILASPAIRRALSAPEQRRKADALRVF